MATANLPGNVTVELINPEHIQSFWLKGRYYEQDMLEYIKQHYKGGTFIDCGACIGNHTLYFATFCAQQVIAIEPVASNVEHMRTNLKLSKLEHKVNIVQAALGEKAGTGAMQYVGNNCGNYQLIAGSDIEVVTLDSIAPLAKHGVKLIKLDIEGSEFSALQGAAQVLERYHPGLFIELASESALTAMDRFLSVFGYKRLARFNSTPTYAYGAFK